MNISSPAVAPGSSFSDQAEQEIKAHSTGFEAEIAAGFDVGADVDEPIDLDGEVRCYHEMLKRVEQQFTAYFLAKIGPSR